MYHDPNLHYINLTVYQVLRYHYRLPSLDSNLKDPDAYDPMPTINEEILDPDFSDASSTHSDENEEGEGEGEVPPTGPTSESHMDWTQLQAYVHYLFDDATVKGKAVPTGGVRKKGFFCGHFDHPNDAQIAGAVDDAGRHIPPPLARLLSELRKLFEPVYKNGSTQAEKAINSHKFFAGYFNQALQSDDWYADDAAELDHFVFKSPSRQPESSRVNKRDREDDEYDDQEPEALVARSTGDMGDVPRRPSKRIALAKDRSVRPRNERVQSAPMALGADGLPR